MKKPILGLIALAAGSTFAQSSLTISGAVDASVTYVASEGVSKVGVGASQLGPSKLTFLGSEDLGGGMRAFFRLEGGLLNDSGNARPSNTNNQASGAAPQLAGAQGFTFARFSYVGATGNFGELRLGRDYTSTFSGALAVLDPFGTVGPADSFTITANLGVKGSKATASTASNMVGYTTPAFGGFSANGQVFLGENASNATNSREGNGYSGLLRYSLGPVYLSMAQQVTRGGATDVGRYQQNAYSASYDFGLAKLGFTHVREKLMVAATQQAHNDSNLLGLTIPVGAANIKASYVRAVQNSGAAAALDNTGTLVGVGADYALSRRTVVYGTWGHVSNHSGNNFSAAGVNNPSGTALSGAVASPSSRASAVGVRHSF